MTEENTAPEPYVNEVGGETPPPAPAANDERMDNTAGQIVEGGEMEVVAPDAIVTNDAEGNVHHNLTGETADPTASSDDAAMIASHSASTGEPALISDLADEPTQMRYISPIKPTICRMVEYRSRTGNYSVPAVINCCVDSIYQPGVEHGFVPPLSGNDHVHLTVFSPGRPGMRMDTGNDNPQDFAENFVVKSKYPVSENVSGCYQEWDIPFDMGRSPGTWCWPERV